MRRIDIHIRHCADSSHPISSLIAQTMVTLVTSAMPSPEETSWNQLVEPFRITDNLYYASVSDVIPYLIATSGAIPIGKHFR